MFHSDFPEAQVIIPCPIIIICNDCDKNVIYDNIFDDGGQLDEQEDVGLMLTLQIQY